MKKLVGLNKDSSYKSVRLGLILFSAFAVISFLYSIIKGKYNGDFMNIQVELPAWILCFNLLMTLTPYIIGWKVYKFFKKRTVVNAVSIPMVFFGNFLIVIMVWNIIVTLAYGVGILGAPLYDAPIFIKPIIQIMNRFQYIYGGMLFILASRKKNKSQFLIVFLLIVLGYLRAGLGIFLYFGLIFLVKYYDEILYFIKKRLLLVALSFLILPILVGSLYDLRSALRSSEDHTEGLTSSELIFGKLTGRLSSFTNSAMIIQEAPYFFYNAQFLGDYYFQQQAIGGMISVALMPKKYPENLLINVYGGDQDYVSYMVGTQGGWYISIMKSFKVFILNLITMLLCVFLTFYFSRLLRLKYANEFAFMLLLYPLTSGVANEYTQLALSIFIYFVLFICVNYYNVKNDTPKILSDTKD